MINKHKTSLEDILLAELIDSQAHPTDHNIPSKALKKLLKPKAKKKRKR